MSTEDTGTRVKKDKAVSCLECRRLKLKCDRMFPCSSCRKRGVAQLCPNAALPTRPRMHLAEVVRSNATLSQMAARVRELEGALAGLQSEHSSQPHPLLANKSLSNNASSSAEAEQAVSGTSLEENPLDSVHETLGTLSIDEESGKSSFFGQSAGMESLYHNDLNEYDPVSSVWPFEPFDPLKDYVLDPLYPRVNRQAILSHLEGYLPDPGHAWQLCDIYYSNAAWLWTAIPRPQFEKDILLPVYGTQVPSFPRSNFTHLSASILFMVFAIASMVDPTRPAEAGEYAPKYHAKRSASSSSNDSALQPDITAASECERFHQLARAALTAGTSIIESPSILGVRTIFLMSIYHVMLDRKQTLQMIWSHLSIALGLASSIGLHRESGRWNLDEVLVEQRRTLFWELYAFMSFIVGLKFGRPPQIPVRSIDCEIGVDPDQKIGPDGEIEHGYEYRLRLMSSTILNDIRDLVLNATPPKYKEVLALDHKLRDCAPKIFRGHVGARNVGPDVLRGPTTFATMRNFQQLFYKEVLVLYLHRKYFVRACALPSDVLPNSLYCPSLLAAFRSAEVIILLMDSLVVLEPELSRRFGFVWNHTLAGAIMVGSIAIRHPRSVLAADAMRALDNVLGLLQRSANTGDRIDRPTKALKIVTQLHEKARWSMSRPQGHEAEAPHPTDELSVLAGQTRLFVSKYTSTPPTSRSTSSSPQEQLGGIDVHASLKDDLNMISRQDQLSYGAPFASGLEHHSAAGAAYHPAHMGASYRASPPLPDMYNDPREHFGGGGVQAHLYQPQMGFPQSTAGATEFNPLFAMGPTDGTEDEISWQGFVAGLGVDR